MTGPCPHIARYCHFWEVDGSALGGQCTCDDKKDCPIEAQARWMKQGLGFSSPSSGPGAASFRGPGVCHFPLVHAAAPGDSPPPGGRGVPGDLK